jgi:hypothetical protein
MKEATKMEMHRSIIWHHSAVRWVPISDKWDIIAVYDSSDQLLFQGSTSEWFLQKQVR